MDRNTKIRNLSIDGVSNVDIAKRVKLSPERIRQIANRGTHPKYYELCYHNKAVRIFMDTLYDIDKELEAAAVEGIIKPRISSYIKTSNAVAELLATWKPTEESDPCGCDVCKLTVK